MKKANTEMAIIELHKGFHMFNKEFFNSELPEPAILIQSKGNKKNVLGWCSVDKIWENTKEGDKRWEINIVSESLNRGVEGIMCTLLHEMVHLHNLVKNIQDTSRNGTYHNKKYKEVAEAHGLIIEHHKKIGWSLSKLNERSVEIINRYQVNPDAFNLSKVDPYACDQEGEEGDKPKKTTSIRKWVCPCCGTIVRSTKEVRIICADCKELFIDTSAEEENENTPIAATTRVPN